MDRHRPGINRNMGCCIQHTRRFLVLIQGMLHQHGDVASDGDLQAIIDETDDILSSGVIRDVRAFSAFYHKLLESLQPLMERFNFPSTSPTFQAAINQNWRKLAGEFFEPQPDVGPPADDAWEVRPPAQFSAFRRMSRDEYDCTRCLQRGHTVGDCQNPIACSKCVARGKNGYGHLARECRSGRCKHCGRKGHDGDNCGYKTGAALCHRCDRPGHEWRQCPNPVKCYKCKRFGHMARDCKN